MTRKIDPITLEILWQRLIAIVDEGDIAVARTSFSSLIRDAHDYSCALFDTKGRMIVQATLTTPGQLGGMVRGLKTFCARFPAEEHNPGDVWVTNDPWLLAGHLPDCLVATPVFHKGRLIAFAGCVFHHADIGGTLGDNNRQVFEEGLNIPPLKLYDRRVLNEAITEILRTNVRVPDQVIGDLRSQVAANHVVSRRLEEMLESEGLDDLDDIAEEIFERSEANIRAGIAQIPDGVYRHDQHLEMPDTDEPLLIRCAVEIKGTDVIVDFEGSSPQVPRGINCVYNFTYAYVFFAIKAAFSPNLPNNDGATRPIIMHAPEGTIVNPKFPAAVDGRHVVGHFMTEIVFSALSTAIPDKVLACSGASPAWWMVISGQRSDGKGFAKAPALGAGGVGASWSADGLSCRQFPGNAMNEPIEVLEAEAPIICYKKEFRQDSGGPGKHRGGLGQEITMAFAEGRPDFVPPMVVAVTASRFRYPAVGSHGGGPGAKSRLVVNGKEGYGRGQLFLSPGDRMELFFAGGGGFGDPLERDVALVAKDVRSGVVSIEAARRDYGVAIDPATLEVDRQATDLIRAARSHNMAG